MADDAASSISGTTMRNRALSRNFSLPQIAIDSFTSWDPIQRSTTSARLSVVATSNHAEGQALLIQKLKPYVSLHVLRRLGRIPSGVDFETNKCPVVAQFYGSVAIIDMS
jgi:hypothetical protein